MNFVISKCDHAHVLVCTGERNGYREWEKVAVLDLPDYLARRDNLEGALVDKVASAAS